MLRMRLCVVQDQGWAFSLADLYLSMSVCFGSWKNFIILEDGKEGRFLWMLGASRKMIWDWQAASQVWLVFGLVDRSSHCLGTTVEYPRVPRWCSQQPRCQWVFHTWPQLVAQEVDTIALPHNPSFEERGIVRSPYRKFWQSLRCWLAGFRAWYRGGRSWGNACIITLIELDRYTKR
jgi:hypothetical protein